MKLPFVLRKKYDAIQNKNINLIKDKVNLERVLDKLYTENEELLKGIINLQEDLKEKNQELDLAKQYNDIYINKNCELNIKLIAVTTKNEEYKEKIKELEHKIREIEFCLEEAKKVNRKSLEIIKRTNMVKKLLINLTTLKDIQGRLLIKDGSVLTYNKVEANKVYDIARLLG